MDSRIKQLALRQWRAELRYWVFGWVLGSLICVVVRPFGTDDLPIFGAVLYWFGINGIATVLMYGVLRIFGGQTLKNFGVQAIFGSLVFTLIYSPILLQINQELFATQFSLKSFFINNFLIALTVFGIVWMAIYWRNANHTVTEVDALQPRFENRLSKYQTATLWAISAQDHYLNVQTDEGAELILMRLGDAVLELADRDGIQTHRSHWVSRNGVAKHTTKSITLHSGETIPISRANAAAVKAFFA